MNAKIKESRFLLLIEDFGTEHATVRCWSDDCRVKDLSKVQYREVNVGAEILRETKDGKSVPSESLKWTDGALRIWKSYYGRSQDE